MLTDRYSLTLSCSSSAAQAHYIAGVDLLLSSQPGADIQFLQALALDPAFAMAHAALARHHQVWGRMAEARAAITAAGTHAAGASRREQQHAALLAALMEGHATDGLRRLIEHLGDFPRDAIALSTALGGFGLIAFSGHPDHDGVRLALCERLAPAYGDDWWFLGYLGWAHVEAGSLQAGERHVERSLALKSDNANAIHAWAHLTYEQGRAAESISRLDALTVSYDTHAALHNHLRWHAALGALAAGQVKGALAIYDQHLAPDVATAPFINALTDAVSLLWRHELATGKPCGGGRWEALHAFIQPRHYQPTVAFLDVHVAGLYAAARDHTAFDALLRHIQAALDGGRVPAGSAVPALCEALRAHAAGDAQQTAALLDAHAGNVVRIGGSGAQRDLFFETLAAAHAHGDNHAAVQRGAVWRSLRASSVAAS